MDKPHKRSEVWRQSMDLTINIYRTTEKFPSQELYGLTNQLRRAAVSIPSNIAEGAARQTKKEFTNFLHIAQGSLSELDMQLDLARRLEYLKDNARNTFDAQMAQIDKMLTGLIRHLSNNKERKVSS
jgi:four helix bundle protein